MSGGALYEWFDAHCIENLPEVARIGCCHQLVNALSTLIGLGIPRAVIASFVEETLDGTARTMATLSQYDLTPGQQLDAVMGVVAEREEANSQQQTASDPDPAGSREPGAESQ